MADTANYGWTKPTVASDDSIWGTILNTALDDIDTDVKAVQDTADAASTTASAALPKAGGTMTGKITVKTDEYPAQALTMSGATSTIDLSAGRFFYGTVTVATTIAFSNLPATGSFLAIILEITNGGAAVLSWPASVKWPGGSAPDLTASGVDVVTLYTRDGGTTWRAALAQRASA